MIAAFYASLFAIFYIFLGLRVVIFRRRYRVGVGAGDHGDLRLAIRTHSNAGEYAPITLILLFGYELGGGLVWALHGLGILFVVARIVHFTGLGFHGGISFGRIYGTTLNYLIILALCSLNLWGGIHQMFGG